MTVGFEFHNWQLHRPEDDARYNRCSPNLLAIGRQLDLRWGTTTLGCYDERDIRAGQSPSSHSHGGATDRSYRNVGRLVAVTEIIPWLIANSAELRVQAIHDYFGSRIWRAGRAGVDPFVDWWRAQPPSSSNGMGQSWALHLHIETTETGWGDSRPIADRFTSAPPGPPPAPAPSPLPIPPGALQTVFTRTLRPGDTGPDVAFVQTVIRAPGSPNGSKQIVVDGRYGPQTEQAVKNIQAFTGNTADGLIGPKTQAVFLMLANS